MVDISREKRISYLLGRARRRAAIRAVVFVILVVVALALGADLVSR